MSQRQKNKTETHDIVSSFVPFIVLPRSSSRTPENKHVLENRKRKQKNKHNFVWFNICLFARPIYFSKILTKKCYILWCAKRLATVMFQKISNDKFQNISNYMFKNVSKYKFPTCWQICVSRSLVSIIFKMVRNSILHYVSNYNCLKMVGHYIVPKMVTLIVFKNVNNHIKTKVTSLLFGNVSNYIVQQC